ncbi:MAG: hypothetical protein LBU30_04990 [Candidatus Methanoplasma sp.]|jgi:hypothetical protein|nr:hypothetical protein [Candidatus Methanoplasma sp.]
MNKKVMSALVALAMVAVAIPVALAENATAETNAGPYGQFNVYMYDGSAWDEYQGTGYNAAIAASAVISALDVDMDYTVQTNWGYNINSGYGTVKDANGDVATVWMYSDSQAMWIQGPTNSLGFYKPFDDYDEAVRTANVALVFAGDDTAALPTAGLQSIVEVTETDDFAVTFTMTADPGFTMNTPDLETGVTGYGSDAYLALANACATWGVDISAQGNVIDTTQANNINLSYGSVQDLDGLDYSETVSGSSTTYCYWSLYLDSGMTIYANWLLGFMSPLDEASDLGADPTGQTNNFVQNEFWMNYTSSTW